MTKCFLYCIEIKYTRTVFLMANKHMLKCMTAPCFSLN